MSRYQCNLLYPSLPHPSFLKKNSLRSRFLSSHPSLFFAVVLVFFGTHSSLFARDRIQVVGSSTVYPFATVVAENLGKGSGLKTPVIESTGTGGGFKLFCSGVGEQFPDVSNASRAIKDSEKELCVKNGVTEIVEIVVGNDGIAFSNSVKGPKLNLSKDELWKAMAAKGPHPKKWSEIHSRLPNVNIEILSPPPTSGTRDAWVSLVMEQGCDAKVKEVEKKDCELFREDGAVVEAGENDSLIVQKLAANKNAFGIFGFSYLDSNRDKIQPMTIEGVEISLDSIQDYSYPVSRPLFFYLKKAHVGVIPGLKEYLSEFTSIDAIGNDGYLADVGLVPLNSDRQKEMRKIALQLDTIDLKG